ncbi:MAG TPA: polysaccharide biosynthesis C-terminal domain-containing protein [Prolixibacteraceae bacterium]|nr:polysaccharide biosynthesis C-terminal domain-containing protein [Prolixibacteraceae bacterium]
MGIIVKQSVKGTIYVYLGVLLGFITTAVLLPNIYSTKEVGLLKIIVTYSTLIAQFATLGINGATIRLFPYFRTDDKKHHGFLPLALTVGMIGFLISAILLLIFKPLLVEMSMEKSTLLVEYINYLVILVFFQLFFSIMDIYYSALKNSVHGTWLREVFQRILIILMIGLYYFNLLSFHQFVISYIAAISVPTAYILYTLIREGQFNLRFELGFLNKNLLRSIGAVSLFSILNGFSVIMIQNVDLIMVNKMMGLDAAGIYAICFFFGIVVSLPARSIYKIANVTAAEAWKNDDRKTLRDIYEKSCITLFVIGSYLFLGVWLNIDNIMVIIGPDYLSGKWVIFFIGLGCLMDMATGANSSLMGTSKYYKVQSYLLLVLVVLIVSLNLLLIPRYGLTGAAAGSAASLGILNLLRYLFLYFKYGLQPYNIRFIYIILIGAVAYFLSHAIPENFHYIIDLVIRSTVFSLIFLLSVYFFRISPDLNKVADDFMKKVKIKG